MSAVYYIYIFLFMTVLHWHRRVWHEPRDAISSSRPSVYVWGRVRWHFIKPRSLNIFFNINDLFSLILKHRVIWKLTTKLQQRQGLVKCRDATQLHKLTNTAWHLQSLRWVCHKCQRVENFSQAKGLKVIWCIHCHLSFGW